MMEMLNQPLVGKGYYNDKQPDTNSIARNYTRSEKDSSTRKNTLLCI